MQKNEPIGKQILLVEDDPSARESIKLLLKIDRHHVTEAKDGIEALALLEQKTFDLVVLDFFMPGMHGGEVARHIKRIAPSLPILMVTAYLEKLSGLDTPVNAVLSKPFAVADLRNGIAKLLSDQPAKTGPTPRARK
ncbi:MAG TPA: response regulator [Verrucomicrobiae bacterium]|nr:response regulator [Verrucomicrobiae bacterium]